MMFVPCPHCADGFVDDGDRHARTCMDVCRTCGGTHFAPAGTGDTAEASFRPDQGAAQLADPASDQAG